MQRGRHYYGAVSTQQGRYRHGPRTSNGAAEGRCGRRCPATGRGCFHLRARGMEDGVWRSTFFSPRPLRHIRVSHSKIDSVCLYPFPHAMIWVQLPELDVRTPVFVLSTQLSKSLLFLFELLRHFPIFSLTTSLASCFRTDRVLLKIMYIFCPKLFCPLVPPSSSCGFRPTVGEWVGPTSPPLWLETKLPQH